VNELYRLLYSENHSIKGSKINTVNKQISKAIPNINGYINKWKSNLVKKAAKCINPHETWLQLQGK